MATQLVDGPKTAAKTFLFALEKTRTAHLENLRTPTLIVQGTRDSFGSREEASGVRVIRFEFAKGSKRLGAAADS